jgi:glutamate racemase
MNSQPIGVFDSGVGGLSVLKEIRALLPNEDLLYVADSAHVPYGDKPVEFVQHRSTALAQFLIDRRAKAIVVACNTASSVALAALRQRFAVPIVGMEPAVKPAAARTRAGRIGVLATGGTLASARFADLLVRFGGRVEVQIQPCPGWVERVEHGAVADDQTRALVERYVAPLVRGGVDTLVLGCTHYPFLQPLIAAVAGPTVSIIDPSPAVARELSRRLDEGAACAPAGRAGTESVWTSGDPDSVRRVVAQLWGGDIDIMRLPELEPPPIDARPASPDLA